MVKTKSDTIILKGKKFILPENRRKILHTWISHENITAENKKFEEEYNALPDSDDYIPKKILKGSIASIVVLTAANKIIKNAELSAENKAALTRDFSKNRPPGNALEYKMISKSLLMCEYLAGFRSMENMSDAGMLKFINPIAEILCKMNKHRSGNKKLVDSAHLLGLGPTGYNSNFPRFLAYAIRKGKVTKETSIGLLLCHRILNKLSQQVIHGDMSRKNIMYKGGDFVIIDPKINLGRPLEDLARFVLKGGKSENGNDAIKAIELIKINLSKRDFEEFEKWLFIYTVSIYVEYINIEKTEKSRLIIKKIDRMFVYLSEHLNSHTII